MLVAAQENSDKRRQFEARGVEVLFLPAANGKVDLSALMDELGKREINELHVEAGFKLNGSLLRAGLVDELVLYMAPTVLGDRARGMFDLPALDTLAQRRELELYDLCRVGRDVRIIARIAPSQP